MLQKRETMQILIFSQEILLEGSFWAFAKKLHPSKNGKMAIWFRIRQLAKNHFFARDFGCKF